MADTIKLKRSSVPGKIPLTTDLQLGELAINTNDGKVFIKKDNGTESIVELSSVGHTHDYLPLTGGNLSGPVDLGSNKITNLASPTVPTDAANASYVNAARDTRIEKAIFDAKGDLIVGTGDNTYDNLPVGTDGQVLMADSTQTMGVKWATPSGGSSSSFPVGTIIEGPTPPSDGGVWLQCNGQTVLQNDYPELFAKVKHAFASFKAIQRSTVSSMVGNFVWTGDRWYMFTTTNTPAYSLDDGQSWTNVTFSGSGVQRIVKITDTGVMLAFSGGSATVYRTEDHGLTWTAISHPGTTSAGYFCVRNGNNIVCALQSGVILSSANLGLTWSTHSLNYITSTNIRFLGYYGGQWVIHFNNPAPKVLISTQELPTSTSDWTYEYQSWNNYHRLPNTGAYYVIVDSNGGTHCGGNSSPSITGLNATKTVFDYFEPLYHANFRVGFQGAHICDFPNLKLVVDTYSSTVSRLPWMAPSACYEPFTYFREGTPIRFFESSGVHEISNSFYQFYLQTTFYTNGTPWVDSSNNKAMLRADFYNVSNSSTTSYCCIMQPNYNTSTEFCLPLTQSKKWIKAL